MLRVSTGADPVAPVAGVAWANLLSTVGTTFCLADADSGCAAVRSLDFAPTGVVSTAKSFTSLAAVENSVFALTAGASGATAIATDCVSLISACAVWGWLTSLAVAFEPLSHPLIQPARHSKVQG